MTSERSIPHLRDIFGLNGYTSHAQNGCGGIGSGGMHTNGPDPYSNSHINLDPKKQSRNKKRDTHKTLTSGDVKTLERHLSMKKTIRKKIMRDLQQAFVDDPNEFQVENCNTEHMKAELKAEALRFGENPSRKSDNFLVMLRGSDQGHHQGRDGNGGNGYDSYNHSAHDYNTPAITQRSNNNHNNNEHEKQSFWKRFTMKTKSKR